jgi:hypothetical protein
MTDWQDEQKAVATGVTEGTIKFRDAFPKDYIMPASRNDVLEEVALEMERFTFAFGVDTVHSFSAFVRSMKD